MTAPVWIVLSDHNPRERDHGLQPGRLSNLTKCICTQTIDLTETNSPMIDVLLQLGYVALVLAVLAFFFCTLPVWLIVVVAVLVLR
jgi:hypothetical protein